MDANITYREILTVLQQLTPEQLDCTATVFVRGIDEYYPVQSFGTTTESDVLDENHPYFLI